MTESGLFFVTFSASRFILMFIQQHRKGYLAIFNNIYFAILACAVNIADPLIITEISKFFYLTRYLEVCHNTPILFLRMCKMLL